MSWREFIFQVHLGPDGRPARDTLGRPKGARWLPELESIARRRFPSSENVASEAFNHALDQLLTGGDTLRPVSEFAGDDERGFRYFASCFINAVEDFSRHRFGRRRPPTWLKNLGGLWLQLYQWLCLERHPSNSIIERLVDRDLECGQRGEAEARSNARMMVLAVRGRIPNCAEQQLDTPLEHTDDDGETRALDLRADGPDPEASLADAEVDTALGALADLLGIQPAASGRWPRVALTDAETVLLRLVYVDELNVSRAAAALGWPEHKARRMLQNCLDRLRDAWKDYE